MLAGPPGRGAHELANVLCSSFPDKFVRPGLLTDRKPAKGETGTPGVLDFVTVKDLAKVSL